MIKSLLLILAFASPLLALPRDPGPVRQPKPFHAVATPGKSAIMVHDVGNVALTLSNYGEIGNPDQIPGLFGMEFPAGSENELLYSAGIWVGAIVNQRKLVSTGTDGDNGTAEFAPTLPIDRYPSGYVATSKQYATLAGKSYVFGAKEVDDDGDWSLADDRNNDAKPSLNWDGGTGVIGRDDDGDGSIDEEIANNLDDDIDGLTDEDTDFSGDRNGDGNCNYDPEPRIDEDPAGDVSHDFIDNDSDGKVDLADDDYDGDLLPNSLDDDGDGQVDEDGVARGTQEYFCVYDDRDRTQVQSPDPDGHTPLNILVLQRSYAWGEAYAGNFVIFDFIVRNVGQLPLTEVYLALFNDDWLVAKGEAGDPASLDDWNYYDAPYMMAISGDDTLDADGHGPGYLGMKILRTPAPPDSLNITFKNFERTHGGDPSTNADKYDLISGDPSENSPPSPYHDDWRVVMGFGPKSGGWLLLPGDELPVTVAFLAGLSIDDLHRTADWAQRIYDNDFQGPSAPAQPEFWCEPHPNRIRIYWRDNAESSIDPITQTADFEGYKLQRSSDLNTWSTLAQYDLIDTLPYPEFERQNFNLGMPYDLYPAGMNWRWEIDSSAAEPDTTGRLYWFDNEDVIAGWTYYYIVRAFDQGVPGAGALVTPIGKSYQMAIAGETQATATGAIDLGRVYVVPNPYKGSHLQESGGALTGGGSKAYPRKLTFMGLPPSGAEIAIYTLAGDHIVTLDHPSGNDREVWDMRNKFLQEIVSGVYYYVVTSGGAQHIDKFVIVK